MSHSGLAPLGNGVVRLWRSGKTSSSYSSGRVQIHYYNRWGSICDATPYSWWRGRRLLQFGITEAHVTCHQLGYTGASSRSKQRYDK